MAWIVGLCPGSMTITGCADELLGRAEDALWVGFWVDDELARECGRFGLVVGCDVVGDDVRLGTLVLAMVDDATAELVDSTSEAVVGLGVFVGREVPQALAVMTVVSAIAIPTTRRRDGVEGEREARVTWPR